MITSCSLFVQLFLLFHLCSTILGNLTKEIIIYNQIIIKLSLCDLLAAVCVTVY